MGARDDYRLLKIVDAISSLNQKVNLIGVIVDYSVPKWTKGTDCFCSIRIVDETHYTHGLSVNIFAETEDKLPHIASPGDIIMLCHVVMKAHNREAYALYNKRFSSFALYEGKHSQNFDPYQVSPKLRPGEHDKKFVAGLRKWSDGFKIDLVSQEPTILLKDIQVGERLNAICKILHVSEVGKNEVVLFAWDGTDAPPLEIHPKLENEKEDPLPLQLEPQPLPRDILSKFPTVGTVVRMKIDQGHDKLCLSSIRAGKWAKFVYLTFEVHAGLWYGIVNPSSRIRFMQDEDCLIVDRQRQFQARSSSKWDRMPSSCYPWPSQITVTEEEDAPYATLMDIITYSKVTAKFKCVVRVVAALPWIPQDFCSPSRTYRVRVTLEDPTARLRAYLYACDGEMFFGGYPSIDVLTEKRNTLLGIAGGDDGSGTEDNPRNPPWVQCCIKSYYLDKTDVWGSRHCRIFGTRLVDD